MLKEGIHSITRPKPRSISYRIAVIIGVAKFSRNIVPKVALVVTFDDLNIAEQAKPTESDKKSVANITPVIRSTNAGSTPPMRIGTTSIGTAAISPSKP